MNSKHLVILLVIGAIVSSSVMPPFWVNLTATVGINVIVAMGLVVLTGVCGLTSFGQAAFVGVGAYAAALSSVHWGLSPWLGLLFALALGLTSGLLLGALTVRLSGFYVPLGTIAWSVVLLVVAGNSSLLGGQTGISGIPSIALGPWLLDGPREMLGLVWAFAGAAIWLTLNLIASRPGRAFHALHGKTIMAESMGVNTSRHKLFAFVYAAVLASLAGWLYAHFQHFVNPTPFGLNKSIEYLFMTVLGGAGSVWGAVIGALGMPLLMDFLQDHVPRIVGVSGSWETVVFAVLVIFMLWWLPGGVWSLIARHLPKRSGIAAPPAATAAAEDTPAVRAQARRQAPVLKVVGARKTFGGLVAVNDVSFEVAQGAIVALIGPNGAGKSTMFDLITGVKTLSAGEVHVFGERVDGRGARAIARQGVARTFQHVKLMGEQSVLENVMLGGHQKGRAGPLRSAAGMNQREEAWLAKNAMDLLEQCGLRELAHMPAASLALGQQRIVEIARALALEPGLLLLDEPAAGLRLNEKQALKALIQSLRARGMSVLLVEHDMDFVMGLVDRIVVMEYGTRIAVGTPAEIQADPRVAKAYLGEEA